MGQPELNIRYLNEPHLTISTAGIETLREIQKSVKFKKVSPSLSAHRRKESKESTFVQNAQKKQTQTDYLRIYR